MTYLDQASWIGSLASVVGVGLTIWTLRTAMSIQKDIYRKHRLPQILKQLKNDMSEYNDFLNRSISLEEKSMQGTLGRISANLSSAQKKHALPEVKRARDSCISLCKKRSGSNESVEIFYGKFSTAIATIENLVQDDKWKL